jgi:cobalt-zinc-cadmium efflux system outer membrane protein
MIRVVCVCAIGMILGCKTVPPVEPSEPASGTIKVKSTKAAVQAEPKPEPDLTGPVTWPMVRDLVLSRHAGLRAESLSKSMADARLAQAELWPNPELAVEMENFGGTAPRNEFLGTETTVTLTQPVPLPGKRDLQKRVASYDRRLAGWQVSQTKRAILLEAAQAYWTVLGMQAQVDLAKKQLDATESLSATVARRVESGKDSPVEMNMARIAAADQRMRLHRVESQLNSARVRLAAMWAGPELFAMISGDLADVPVLPEQAVLLEGLETHPALIRWADAIQKARAQKDLARKQGYDDWAVTGGIKRLEEEHETLGVIGLAIPLPVFNRNQGRRQEAIYRLAQVRALKQDAHQRLTVALETHAIATRHTYQEVVILRDDIVPQAKIAYERSLTGYEQGRFDYLHVLDAQRMWFDQSQRYVETLLTYGLARAQVVSLAGLDYDFKTQEHEGDHDE